MWILVYIWIEGSPAQLDVAQVEEPMTMSECFKARDSLSAHLGRGNGSFDPGSQAVCIQLEEGQ